MGGIYFEIHYIILFAVFGRNIDFTINGRDDDDGLITSQYGNQLLKTKQIRLIRVCFFRSFVWQTFDGIEANSRSVVFAVTIFCALLLNISIFTLTFCYIEMDFRWKWNSLLFQQNCIRKKSHTLYNTISKRMIIYTLNDGL